MSAPSKLRSFTSFLVVLLLFCVKSFGRQDCSGAVNCRDCIGRSIQCAWCSVPVLMSDRCMNLEEIASSCREEFIDSPQGEASFFQSDHSTLEQFSPSRVEVGLRVDEASSFLVNVTPSANYPLDLYFLMDLSYSMRPFVDQLFNLSLNIANTLNDITSDFRIGFGAFNEKPVLPFTKFSSSVSPAPRTDYSYRHYLSLTTNTTKLGEVSQLLEVVLNDDAPEAMLDGLLQSVVCTDLVGWRQEARKLVIVFTDQLYHIAGDGLLAGLSRPSGGNCHTVKTSPGNVYSEYILAGTRDYPSIGMIRRQLEEKDIIPIFATVLEFQENYRYLVQELPGAIFQSIGSTRDIRNAFLFPSSQTNISISHTLFLRIIRDSIQVASQRVELLPLTSSADFQVSVDAFCLREEQEVGQGCDNVRTGETVTFNVTIVLTQCASSRNNLISLRIPGFGAVPVNVTSICECLCEDDKEANSTFCSEYGDLSCGLCECYDNRFGSRCQCDSPEAVDLPCSSGLSQPCSGRGSCECGMCICSDPLPSSVPPDIENATYYGENCECDDFNCPKGLEGLVCSGRGDCDCGSCLCFSNSSDLAYRGLSCELRPAEEVCINEDSNDTIFCSDRGSCPGESCVCNMGFEGKFCEKATPVFVEVDVCASGENCLRCSEGFEPTGTMQCSNLNCSVVSIATEEDDYMIAGAMATTCEFVVGSCLYIFYTVGADQPIHLLPAECRGLLLPVWAVVLIVIGAMVVLTILALIITRCIIACRDRYDVRQWEKQRGLVEFGKAQNPLYFSPEQKYLNVGYRDKSPTKTSSPKETLPNHFKFDPGEGAPSYFHVTGEVLSNIGNPPEHQWNSYH